MNARWTHTRFPQGNESLTALRPPFSVLRRQSSRKGMTLIELGIVMGIVSILLALVLSLGRHVNAVVKIRRAQADLGEWHEALNRWHLQFGEYPYEAVDIENGTVLESDLINTSTPSFNLSNVLERCYLRYAVSGSTTNITFRSFLTSDITHIDPWGTPYIYDCDPGRKSYTLFSCGSDSSSVLNGSAIGRTSTPDPTLDDIYFER